MMTPTAPTADRLDNTQDVVEYLIGQHMQIRNLFDEVMRSSGGPRRDLFERLATLLAVHETAEEQLIHPLVRAGVDGGDAIVDDRLREERSAKEMLVALENLDPDGSKFSKRLEDLRLSVLEHAHKEEAYEFRYLRREVEASKTGALLQTVRAAEAVAPTHPHPGVESATANTVLGPIVSLFDRTRDLLTGRWSNGESGSVGGVSGSAEQPLSRPSLRDYDELTAQEIIGRLRQLSQQDLERGLAYERSHANRSTVVGRMTALRAPEPWPGYDTQTVEEVRSILAGSDDETRRTVRAYERKHKERVGVLKVSEPHRGRT